MAGQLPAIETFGLSKRYLGSSKYALRDLDLDIMPGEVYGFLGPNGAGKSTTIRLLMNFIQPTHGQAQILGSDVVSKSFQIKSQIGYLPGELVLYPKMTGWQFLDYMNSLQPAKSVGFIRRLASLFEVELNKKIAKLSKGNKQKIGLIQAFMHEPGVLILDEPTAGLDPLIQEVFFELVRATKNRGATLFISSHNLSEVQKICDRVGFIRKGRLIAEQSISDLSKSASQTYDINFAEVVPKAELRQLPRSKIKINTPHHVTIQMTGDLKPLFMFLARHQVRSLDRREINLEDEFLKFYRGKGKL